MARRKLQQFLENSRADNVIEKGKAWYTTIKGKWNSDYFKNKNPITLELACGKGELSVTFAKNYPDRNFIGVDVKGARIWTGSQAALDQGMNNVAFLRTSIQYMEEFFEPGEVAEIYIMFPDPQPFEYQEKYRLTSSGFLTIYKKLLQPGGNIHLKTDNAPLYHYTKNKVLKEGGQIVFGTESFYESEMKEAHFGVRTRYETMFTAKGEVVHYLIFKLN